MKNPADDAKVQQAIRLLGCTITAENIATLLSFAKKKSSREAWTQDVRLHDFPEVYDTWASWIDRLVGEGVLLRRRENARTFLCLLCELNVLGVSWSPEDVERICDAKGW